MIGVERMVQNILMRCYSESNDSDAVMFGCSGKTYLIKIINNYDYATGKKTKKYHVKCRKCGNIKITNHCLPEQVEEMTGVMPT